MAVRVLILSFGEQVRYLDVDIKLFLALSNKAFLKRFAIF